MVDSSFEVSYSAFSLCSSTSLLLVMSSADNEGLLIPQNDHSKVEADVREALKQLDEAQEKLHFAENEYREAEKSAKTPAQG
jgi:hypothetical protein